jgi:translation elongation factor EF-4
MTLASPTAILEQKITLHSVEGDDVVLHASPEWKRKLADFIYYASTTRDVEVAPVVNVEWLENARKDVLKSSQNDSVLRLHKKHIFSVMPAFNALDVMDHCDFYDYDADDFDRLHDDFMSIYEQAINNERPFPRRIKVGLASEFDG